MRTSVLLEQVVEDFAEAIPAIDANVETRNVAHFEGLRHPVHQQGAVVTWEVTE